MMTDYQERLDAFAEGRKFARMSRPIRNRADGWCDACGSVLARVLFGIKDERSGQIYFVGERCLQQLAERGAVVRRFLKQSAEDAYAARYDRPARIATPPSKVTAPAPPPVLPTPLPAPVSPELLTATLVLAAPNAEAGMPPQCLSVRLEGEPATRTLALLQTWPALRQQLQTLGLDGKATNVTSAKWPATPTTSPATAGGPAPKQSTEAGNPTANPQPTPKRRASSPPDTTDREATA